MSPEEMLSWADTTVTELGWYIQEYRKRRYVEAILEVQRNLIMLQAVSDELYDDYCARNTVIN
jgi:hypothetical protein